MCPGIKCTLRHLFAHSGAAFTAPSETRHTIVERSKRSTIVFFSTKILEDLFYISSS
jgi:hypothetical protein